MHADQDMGVDMVIGWFGVVQGHDAGKNEATPRRKMTTTFLKQACIFHETGTENHARSCHIGLVALFFQRRWKLVTTHEKRSSKSSYSLLRIICRTRYSGRIVWTKL